MNFNKLRNYNTVILSLIFTIGILYEILVVLDGIDSKHSIITSRRREAEAPEPALPSPTFFPAEPILLDGNNHLFMLPQISIPQEVKQESDSISLLMIKANEEEVTPILGHLVSAQSLAEQILIFNGKTAAYTNILPPGLLAHSVTLVQDEPGNWLCFLARSEKGLPHDELYMYSLSTAKTHRIGKPGMLPVELHMWKNQSSWIVSMGEDLNKDGFINKFSESTELMVYNSDLEQLKPIE